VNQQRAINCVENYLASNSDRQAMVRMPTGTGKTAVIATLAQLLADKPRCLVVAPWEYLVTQLQREVCERFWQKVGEDSSFTPKPCEIFTPSRFSNAVKAAGSAGVLLCTNQTLQALRPLLVYCPGGHRSSIVPSSLQSRRFPRVSEIAGGIVGWEAANLSVQTAQALS
jgi:rhodanese-related sulfurtransferase